MGTWMQRSAQIWLVYSMTKSPALLGLLGICQSSPVLLLSLPAGVYCDRFPKRKMIIITQTMFTLQAFAMAALTWSGRAQYWQILVLAAVQGITTAFDNPARQSFYIHLVGKEDLMNAISLNSSIMNLAKTVGPSVTGVVMATMGPAPCFLLNAISFLAVIYGLLLITVDGAPREGARPRGNVWGEVGEGLSYIWKSDTLRLTAVIVTIASIFAMNSNVIIPVFVDTVLHKGVKEYGFLMSVNGFGALLGALTMATRSRNGLNGAILVWDTFIFCGIQVLLSFSRSVIVSAVLIAALGAFNMAFMNMANSILQLSASDEFRGRVMAFYMLIHNGATPIGNGFAGVVMEQMGGGAGFLAGGSLTFALVTLLFITERRRLREGLLARASSA
jgi:predicted MFS family arabinose efflux permease